MYRKLLDTTNLFYILNQTIFFFTATATTVIYTLSLHDALPISTARKSTKSLARIPHASVSCTASVVSRTSEDRKSTRLNSSHVRISYAVFCLKKKKQHKTNIKHISLATAKYMKPHTAIDVLITP